jgi:glycosyltransferase involved in cell wall biosynthesis
LALARGACARLDWTWTKEFGHLVFNQRAFAGVRLNRPGWVLMFDSSMMAERIVVCHVTTVHDAFDDRIYYRECLTLARAGYRVVIVAPSYDDRRSAGVSICELSKPRCRSERFTKTLWTAYRRALALDADLYHLHDPELMVLGALLRARGKCVIYDAHEDLPDDIVTKEWLPSLLRLPLASLANFALSIAGMLFSGIIAATPHIARRFPAKKVVVVSNYPSVEAALSEPATPYEQRSGAVYVGSLSEIRGVVEMVQAFSDPRVPASARLAIAGTFGASGNEAFERYVRSLPGWSHVDFLGWKTHDDVQRLLRSARLGLVLLHPTRSFLESLPSKLFEYMAAGLPVVASDFPLWRKIVAEASCGILVNPLNPGEIAEAVSFLLNNPQEAEAMGCRGREAMRRSYSWAQQAERLLDQYKAALFGGRALAVEHA